MAVQGNLRDISLAALMQLNCQEGNRACLSIQRGDAQALLYFADGSVVHAVLRPGGGRDESEGEEVVVEALDWEDGAFRLETDVDPPAQTISTPWSVLLFRGLQRHDEEHWATLESEERNRRFAMAARTTTDVLKELLEVPGITTTVVIGRDGFVIEAAGNTKAVNLDALGASLAHAINGIEMMGKELQIRSFRDLFVEYESAMIIARPVGDAIIALVSPDASQLGIVRFKIKPLVTELANFF